MNHLAKFCSTLVLGFLMLGIDNASTPPVSQDNPKHHTFWLAAHDTRTGSNLNLSVSCQVKHGTNALEAMKSLLQVKESPKFPGYVDSIAGIAAPKGDYWALYVNGTYVAKGIATFEVDKEYLVVWRMKKIDDD